MIISLIIDHYITVEVLDFWDPAIQFDISEPHVKNLLSKYLLDEMGSFEFQVNIKVVFRKEIGNSGKKYLPSIT